MFNQAVFNLQEASKDQVQEFLNSFDTVLTDCDGTFNIFHIYIKLTAKIVKVAK